MERGRAEGLGEKEGLGRKLSLAEGVRGAAFLSLLTPLSLQWVREENPDVLCLQETKCAEKSLPADITSMPEYPFKYWAGSEDKEGYSGVAMLCKTEPVKVTYGIGEWRQQS